MKEVDPNTFIGKQAIYSLNQYESESSIFESTADLIDEKDSTMKQVITID